MGADQEPCLLSQKSMGLINFYYFTQHVTAVLSITKVGGKLGGSKKKLGDQC